MARLLRMRALRGGVAGLLILAVGIVFLAHQSQMERMREDALDIMSSNSWRISEIIVETQRFNHDLENHLRGIDSGPPQAPFDTVSLDELQLAFEILWSNINVTTEGDIRSYPEFATALDAYSAFLKRVDPLIYNEDGLSLSDGMKIRDGLTSLGAGMHQTWQRFNRDNSFADRARETKQRSRASRQQAVILLLMAALVVYLLVESHLAMRAQKRQALLEARAQAAARESEVKSRFLANVSHEIRTPLNGILGMASELSETALDDDQKTCVGVITHAGDVLLHTLNDVLDLSKMDTAEFAIEKTKFNLRKTVDAAVSLYMARAREKSLELTCDVADDLPDCIIGDVNRISQVLHNLIGNAVKFTDAGSVCVVLARGAAQDRLRVNVTDTGPGIPAHAKARIFEPFAQVNDQNSRSKGGTGLGLSICQGLISAMGGVIGVETVAGQGATFWFEIPLLESTPEAELHDATTVSSRQNPEHGSETAPAPSASSESAALRILLTDDNKTNRVVVQRYLKSLPVDIWEATNGQEAIDLIEQQPFDLVLMDIQMPVMDGIEAVGHIRGMERAGGRRIGYVVAATANVMRHQTDEYLRHGFDAVLPKPITKQAMLNLIASCRPGMLENGAASEPSEDNNRDVA